MYNTFDRSLYPYADKLCSLPLHGWLIDGRGQDPEYLRTALQSFADLREQQTSDDAIWKKLQASGERVFKPGFFLANNTDYCFEEDAQEHASERCYGIVMDVIRGKFCTVLLQEPLTAETAVTMNIPGGRSATIDLSRMQSITGETINSANGGNLIRLPWCKGLVPTSRLVASS